MLCTPNQECSWLEPLHDYAPRLSYGTGRVCARKSGLWVATALVSRACAFLAHAQTTTTFYLHTTVPIASAKTPTLTEVCWRRALPVERNGTYVVGLKFLL